MSTKLSYVLVYYQHLVLSVLHTVSLVLNLAEPNLPK